MTVNPVAFYVLASLILACSLGAVLAGSLRAASGGLAAATVVAALLEAVTGARLLAVLHLALVAVVAGGVLYFLRRQGYDELLRLPSPRSGWWPAAAVGATAVGSLGVWAAVVHRSDWHRGIGTAALVSVLHQREPIVAGVAAILLICGIGGSILVGSVGADEREFERRRLERRQRDERTRRRREDRLAARGRADASGAGGRE